MGQATSTIEHFEEALPALYQYNHPEDMEDEESVCNITDYLRGLVPESYFTEEDGAIMETVEGPEKNSRDDSTTMSNDYYRTLSYLPPRQAIHLGTPSPTPIDRDDPDYLDLGFERAVEEAQRIREQHFRVAPIPALLNEFVHEPVAGSFRRTIEENAAKNKKERSKTPPTFERRNNNVGTVDNITQRQKEHFEATPQIAIDSNGADRMDYQNNEGSQDYLFSIGNAAAILRERSTPPAQIPPQMHPSMYQQYPGEQYPSYTAYPPTGHYPYPPYPGTQYNSVYHGTSPMVYGHPQVQDAPIQATSVVPGWELPPTSSSPRASNPALTQYDAVHTSPSTQHIQQQPTTSRTKDVERKTSPTISLRATNPQQTQYESVYETSPVGKSHGRSSKPVSPQVTERKTSPSINPRVSGPAQTQYDPVSEAGTTPPPRNHGSPKTEVNISQNAHHAPANRGATQYAPVHQGTCPESYSSPGYQAALPATPVSARRSTTNMMDRLRASPPVQTQYDNVAETVPKSMAQVSPRQTQYDPVSMEEEEYDEPPADDTIIEINVISPRERPQATQYDSVSEEAHSSRAAIREDLNQAIKPEFCNRVDASFDTELNRSCTIPAVSSCGSQMDASGAFDTVSEEPEVEQFKKPIIKITKQKTITNYFLPPLPRPPRRVSSLSILSVPLRKPGVSRVSAVGIKPVQPTPLQPKRSQAVLQEVDKNLEHQKRRKTMPATSTPLPNAIPFTVPESLDTMAPPHPVVSPPSSRQMPNEVELRKRNQKAYFEILAKQIPSEKWTIESVKNIWKEACRNVEQRRQYQAHMYAVQQHYHQAAMYHAHHPAAAPHAERGQKFARYSYPIGHNPRG